MVIAEQGYCVDRGNEMIFGIRDASGHPGYDADCDHYSGEHVPDDENTLIWL